MSQILNYDADVVNSQFKKAFNKKISELPLKRKSGLKRVLSVNAKSRNFVGNVN